MYTKILGMDQSAIDRGKIQEAAEIIRKGGVVAFPTETVYGLGGDAKRADSAKKIYEAKGRPSDNPLIVHIGNYNDLKAIVTAVPDKARLLAEAFWPGPLTMIFQKNEVIPYETTGGLETVAVRMPAHPVALALIKESGGYIAAPSANSSGKPSPTLAEHTFLDLQGRIPLILDGGQVGLGIESTIVDFSELGSDEALPVILRPGSITKEAIEKVIGPVARGGMQKEEKAPKAPGMKYKHYSPNAELILVTKRKLRLKEDLVQGVDPAQLISRMAADYLSHGKKVGIIATKENQNSYPQGIVKIIGSRENEEEIAQNLYKLLREFDDLEVDTIFSETFWKEEENSGVAEAIMNRLKKASTREVFT